MKEVEFLPQGNLNKETKELLEESKLRSQAAAAPPRCHGDAQKLKSSSQGLDEDAWETAAMQGRHSCELQERGNRVRPKTT